MWNKIPITLCPLVLKLIKLWRSRFILSVGERLELDGSQSVFCCTASLYYHPHTHNVTFSHCCCLYTSNRGPLYQLRDPTSGGILAWSGAWCREPPPDVGPDVGEGTANQVGPPTLYTRSGGGPWGTWGRAPYIKHHIRQDPIYQVRVVHLWRSRWRSVMLNLWGVKQTIQLAFLRGI